MEPLRSTCTSGHLLARISLGRGRDRAASAQMRKLAGPDKSANIDGSPGAQTAIQCQCSDRCRRVDDNLSCGRYLTESERDTDRRILLSYSSRPARTHVKRRKDNHLDHPWSRGYSINVVFSFSRCKFIGPLVSPFFLGRFSNKCRSKYACHRLHDEVH